MRFVNTIVPATARARMTKYIASVSCQMDFHRVFKLLLNFRDRKCSEFSIYSRIDRVGNKCIRYIRIARDTSCYYARVENEWSLRVSSKCFCYYGYNHCLRKKKKFTKKKIVYATLGNRRPTLAFRD